MTTSNEWTNTEMAYDPNTGYYQGSKRGFSRPQNYDNGQNNRGPYAGNAQAQNGGNVRGQYKPNTGKALHNRFRRGPKDPSHTGTMNVVTPDGQMHTFDISIWSNDDGTLGCKFKNVLDRQQGQGNGGHQQGQRGQYRGNGGYQPQQGYQQPQHNPNGAMSRARPIPPAQYQNGPYDDRSPPPITEYPEGAPSDYDIQYDDDGNPPY